MRERVRRQSRRRTRVQLHRSLSADGRAWVNEVWQAGQRVAADPALLSPLTSLVARSVAQGCAAALRLDSEGAQLALLAAIKIGYASRAVLVSPTNQPSIEASSFRIAAPIDVEQAANDTDAREELIDVVRSIASDSFDSVMTLPREVWSAYVAVAAMELQENLSSNTSSLSWRELDRDTIEGLLRYGYVLRCLDEALDRSPDRRKSR
jgi:hypothetical protein